MMMMAKKTVDFDANHFYFSVEMKDKINLGYDLAGCEAFLGVGNPRYLGNS